MAEDSDRHQHRKIEIYAALTKLLMITSQLPTTEQVWRLFRH